MKNKAKTLFIFEGRRTEEKYVEKLEANFFGDRHAIKCVYDAEIYQLYKTIKAENGFFDIVSLLKERNTINAEALKEYKRDSFAYIYLFFDYDAHSTMAEDYKLEEMLTYFNDETENGLLYISYPMVEAIRHFKDRNNFKDLTVKCKRDKCTYLENCEERNSCLNEPHYKQFAELDSNVRFCNVNKYTTKIWQELIFAHLCKANYIVNDDYSFPLSQLSQRDIFTNQMKKYINKKCPKVAVLSAFPLYVLDYYGCDNTKEKLEKQNNAGHK